MSHVHPPMNEPLHPIPMSYHIRTNEPSHPLSISHQSPTNGPLKSPPMSHLQYVHPPINELAHPQPMSHYIPQLMSYRYHIPNQWATTSPLPNEPQSPNRWVTTSTSNKHHNSLPMTKNWELLYVLYLLKTKKVNYGDICCESRVVNGKALTEMSTWRLLMLWQSLVWAYIHIFLAGLQIFFFWL
jgi:hypothetical protein